MTTQNVARRSVAADLSDILASPEVVPPHRRASSDPLDGPSRLPARGR